MYRRRAKHRTKRYAYVTILGFFALCSQAFATSLLPTPNVNTQGQDQMQGRRRAGPICDCKLGSWGHCWFCGNQRVEQYQRECGGEYHLCHPRCDYPECGCLQQCSLERRQSITFNSPSEVTTRASGTTEVRTVATVVAPDMVTTANCIVGASGGATGLGWGFAIGTGIEDKNCTRRENARLLKNLGKAEAAVKIMCNDPEVAAALGADCPPVVQPLPAK